jgi:hypothetical protein
LRSHADSVKAPGYREGRPAGTRRTRSEGGSSRVWSAVPDDRNTNSVRHGYPAAPSTGTSRDIYHVPIDRRVRRAIDDRIHVALVARGSGIGSLGPRRGGEYGQKNRKQYSYRGRFHGKLSHQLKMYHNRAIQVRMSKVRDVFPNLRRFSRFADRQPLKNCPTAPLAATLAQRVLSVSHRKQKALVVVLMRGAAPLRPPREPRFGVVVLA